MVILRSQNKITDFLMILAWASPFKRRHLYTLLYCDQANAEQYDLLIVTRIMNTHNK